MVILLYLIHIKPVTVQTMIKIFGDITLLNPGTPRMPCFRDREKTYSDLPLFD